LIRAGTSTEGESVDLKLDLVEGREESKIVQRGGGHINGGAKAEEDERECD